jgi:ABC-type oligopeptide transport system ATPase subunit
VTALPAVPAAGLVKTFRDRRAVDGIDLDIRQGEVFGVLGPNGAGKTTILKMLATLSLRAFGRLSAADAVKGTERCFVGGRRPTPTGHLVDRTDRHTGPKQHQRIDRRVWRPTRWPVPG